MNVLGIQPTSLDSTAHAMGSMNIADILWQLQELHRELAANERNYNHTISTLERRRELDAKKAEVDTYRGWLSKVLNSGTILLDLASGAAGFGNKKEWGGIAKGLAQISQGVGGVKKIDEMNDGGNRTEAAALAQMAGEARRLSEEARKRGQQEIAEALQQLQKVCEMLGHLADKVTQ